MMFSGLVITLREGLEAALIIGIVLAYLNRSGYYSLKKYIWQGAVTAILISLGLGLLIFIYSSGFTGRTEEIFEGLTMLLAAVVLTYMVIWMKKQSSSIKKEIEKKVDQAVIVGSGLALFFISFTAVAREGIETVLFLLSAFRTSSLGSVLFGGLVGLILAIIIGFLVFKGSNKINLRTFFNLTGIVLIFFAGGLLAHGLYEFQEAGILPFYIQHVWDINWLISENGFLGSFLKSILGYNGNPSLLEVITYFTYIPMTLFYFFRQSLSLSGRKKVLSSGAA